MGKMNPIYKQDGAAALPNVIKMISYQSMAQTCEDNGSRKDTGWVDENSHLPAKRQPVPSAFGL